MPSKDVLVTEILIKVRNEKDMQAVMKSMAQVKIPVEAVIRLKVIGQDQLDKANAVIEKIQSKTVKIDFQVAGVNEVRSQVQETAQSARELQQSFSKIKLPDFLQSEIKQLRQEAVGLHKTIEELRTREQEIPGRSQRTGAERRARTAPKAEEPELFDRYTRETEALMDAIAGIEGRISSFLKGGARGRSRLQESEIIRQKKAQKALLFASAEERADMPGFLATTARRFEVDPLSLRLPGIFEPRRLLHPETLVQLGFAMAFGEIPSLFGGLIGGATPLGPSGALLGSLISSGIQRGVISPFRHFLETERDHAKAAAEAFQRSILGITAIRQANLELVDPNLGVPTALATAQRRQAQAAKDIQFAARAKLLPLGIAGQTEATFVQGIIAALSQRGLQASPEEVARIAELLGGAIVSQRPGLLENTQLLLRDIEDVIGGGPAAKRTILSQLIRPALPGLQRARTAAEIQQSLEVLGPMAQTAAGLENPIVVINKLNAALDNMRTQAGVQFLDALVPAYKKLTDVLKDPKVVEATEKIGKAMGEVAAFGLKATASLIDVGARIGASLIDPLKSLTTALGAASVALIAFEGIVRLISGGSLIGGGLSALGRLGGASGLLMKGVKPSSAFQKIAATEVLGGSKTQIGIGGHTLISGGGTIGAAAKALLRFGIGLSLLDLATHLGVGLFEAHVEAKDAEAEARQAKFLERTVQSAERVRPEVALKAAATRVGLREEFEKIEAEAGELSPRTQLDLFKRQIAKEEQLPGGLKLSPTAEVAKLKFLDVLETRAFEQGVEARFNLNEIEGRIAADEARRVELIPKLIESQKKRLKLIAESLEKEQADSKFQEQLNTAKQQETEKEKARAKIQDDLAKVEKSILKNRKLIDAGSRKFDPQALALRERAIEQEPQLLAERIALKSELQSIERELAEIRVLRAETQKQLDLPAEQRESETIIKLRNEGKDVEENIVKLRQQGLKLIDNEVQNIQQRFAFLFERTIDTTTARGRIDLAETALTEDIARRRESTLKKLRLAETHEERVSAVAGIRAIKVEEFARERQIRAGRREEILEDLAGVDPATFRGDFTSLAVRGRAITQTVEDLRNDLAALRKRTPGGGGEFLPGDLMAQSQIQREIRARELELQKAELEQRQFGESVLAGIIARPKSLIESRKSVEAVEDAYFDLVMRAKELARSLQEAAQSADDFAQGQRLRELGALGQRVSAGQRLLKAGGTLGDFAGGLDVLSLIQDPNQMARFELEFAREQFREVLRQTDPWRQREQEARQKERLEDKKLQLEREKSVTLPRRERDLTIQSALGTLEDFRKFQGTRLADALKPEAERALKTLMETVETAVPGTGLLRKDITLDDIFGKDQKSLVEALEKPIESLTQAATDLKDAVSGAVGGPVGRKIMLPGVDSSTPEKLPADTAEKRDKKLREMSSAGEAPKTVTEGSGGAKALSLKDIGTKLDELRASLDKIANNTGSEALGKTLTNSFTTSITQGFA